MNRIDKINKSLKINKKKAFVAYITAGFPDLKTTFKLVQIFQENGVDFIELGMPFSDPVADGPTIQRSSAIALRNGMNLKKFFYLVKKLRNMTEIPLIMMSYYNPIFKYGLEKFSCDAAESGLDGLIVPDLPPEEAAELNVELKRQGISLIFLISPVTEPSRIKKIARASRGFIYYVSLTGVTGARKKLPADLAKHVKLIKKVSDTPVFVGFGVSSPEQVRQVFRTADGVIVGSAIIKAIEKNIGKKNFLKNIGAYLRSLNLNKY